MLTLSRLIGDLILPSISIYDVANAPYFPLLTVISYVSTIVFYLVAAIAVINRREFFYARRLIHQLPTCRAFSWPLRLCCSWPGLLFG